MQGNKQIKCILFDADGVTIISTPFSRHLEKDYGITQEMTSQFFNGIFRECLVGKADLKKELPDYLKEWKWPGSLDKFLGYWFSSESVVDKRVLDVIASYRKDGIPCYLATNQEKYRTEYIRNQMGFGRLFDGIFSSAYLGCKKPDNEFFEGVYQALEKEYDVKKKEIMFCDDSAKHVDAARKFGFNAFQYKDFISFKRKLKSNIS